MTLFRIVLRRLRRRSPPESEEIQEGEKSEYRKIEDWLRQDLNATRWVELSGVIPQLVELSIKENKPLFRERTWQLKLTSSGGCSTG